jgi:hypothetical protein
MMAQHLFPKAAAFMAKNPTLIGRVGDCNFYEHPTLGDEHALIAVTDEGKKVMTPFYDMPSFNEFCDWQGWNAQPQGFAA